MSHDATQPTLALQQGQPRPNKRILVADDEPGVRTVMSVVLRRAGYHVDTVQDGAAAWTALLGEHYVLLITDYDMPKVNGIELVTNLRFARMYLPVIMVTATLPLAELAQIPSLQLTATLEKPFTVSDLLETVGKVMAPAFSLPETIPSPR